MASFINLLADADWSDDDIVNHVESLVGKTVSPVRERILKRRMFGALLPIDHPWHRPLTPAQQQEIAAAVVKFDEADALVDAAIADMALLRQAWAVERGDLAAASAEVLELVSQRATARGEA